MAQTTVSLAKGSGSRARLRTALNTIQSNFTDLYTRVTAVEGGGGGAPEWVPENAIAFINFAATNRGAWTETDGDLALTAVVGSDTDANDSGFGGTTAYDPGDLTADGIITQGSMAFLGPVKALFLAGCTAVFKLKDIAADSTSYPLALVDASGETAIFVEVDTGDGNDVKIVTVAGNSTADVNATILEGADSENAIAFTLTPTRGELSVNNSAAASDTFNTSDWPTSGDVPTAAMYHNTSPDDVLVSVAIYDTLPSTAGLQALANF
jgi:hypothetical protein